MSDAILRDFPSSFESERLLIRSPQPGDGRVMRQAVLESQEHLALWMPWAMKIDDELVYEALMRKKYVQFLSREDMQMLLFLKGTNTLIGSSGLHRLDWSVPKVEIGYWIHPSYQGHGYVTEAVQAITTFSFETLGAKRVEIRCDADNDRSAAVARRAGFTLEGILRHESRHHLTNDLLDTMIFARVVP